MQQSRDNRPGRKDGLPSGHGGLDFLNTEFKSMSCPLPAYLSEENFARLNTLARERFGVGSDLSFKGKTKDSAYLRDLTHKVDQKMRSHRIWTGTVFHPSSRRYEIEINRSFGDSRIWFPMEKLMLDKWKDTPSQQLRFLLKDVFARMRLFMNLWWVHDTGFFQWRLEANSEDIQMMLNDEEKENRGEKPTQEDEPLLQAQMEEMDEYFQESGVLKEVEDLFSKEMLGRAGSHTHAVPSHLERFQPSDEEKTLFSLALQAYYWLNKGSNPLSILWEHGVKQNGYSSADELMDDVENGGCMLIEPEVMIGLCLGDRLAEDAICDDIDNFTDNVILSYTVKKILGKENGRKSDDELFFGWLSDFYTEYNHFIDLH